MRCSIHFTYGDEPAHANVYRHTDGYPNEASGILSSLDEFFGAVEEQCGVDTRFGDCPPPCACMPFSPRHGPLPMQGA